MIIIISMHTHTHGSWCGHIGLNDVVTVSDMFSWNQMAVNKSHTLAHTYM